MNAKFILGAIGYLLLLVSCSNDLIVDTPGTQAAGLRIYFNIPTQQVVKTRARDLDNYVIPQSVYVFAFDASNKLVEYKNAVGGGQEAESLYHVNLTVTSEYRNLYVVTNAADIIKFKEPGWEIGITTLDNIKSDLLTTLDMDNGMIIGMPPVHPMSGNMVFPSGYSSATTIGTLDAPVLLTRATIKIRVAAVTDANVEVLGANLANASSKGYVIASPASPETIAVANYGTTADGTDGMLGIVENQLIDIYGYESPSQNETFVVLKAKYKGVVGYYRINLTDAAGKQYTLVRNHEYRVTITDISSPGYRTAAEAIANAMSNNVVYDITVTDGYSHDIVSNGQYYLGVSNSEFFIYSDEDIVGESIAVVTHNAPATVWQGTAIVVASEGGTATVNNPFGASDGSPQSQSLNITMPKSVTSATVFLQVGNLTKTITVKRRYIIDAVGELIEEFGSKEYVSGEVEPNSGWLKVSALKSKAGMGSSNVVNPAGGVYFNIDNNVGFDEVATTRRGTFYVGRSDDKGRTKVTVVQEHLNVYKDKNQIGTNAYAGTFHRWYQTGERLIRIEQTMGNSNSKWKARVVRGEEWIELSAKRSPDMNIGKDPYGAGDNSSWTDADIETLAQLNTDSITLSGQGKNIYFRIGLKSKLPGGLNGQPRYGLVVITHDRGEHLIFVRQGEQADYLMRPSDPIMSNPDKPGNPTAPRRPYAVRYSPYNLTNPVKDSDPVQLAVRGADFVDYPSKGGYFFQGASKWAYPPIGNGKSNWYDESYHEADFEVSPVGFRRPDDGRNGITGSVAESEVRQSLWLYPINGQTDGNYQNMIRGYVADGYFDRKEMRIPNLSLQEGINGNTKEKCMVGYNSEVAFAGTLFFNPYNFASLFLPANGSVTYKGELSELGSSSYAWTSTVEGVAISTWYVAVGYFGWSGYVAENYPSNNNNGFSIRCVKDEPYEP